MPKTPTADPTHDDLLQRLVDGQPVSAADVAAANATATLAALQAEASLVRAEQAQEAAQAARVAAIHEQADDLASRLPGLAEAYWRVVLDLAELTDGVDAYRHDRAKAEDAARQLAPEALGRMPELPGDYMREASTDADIMRGARQALARYNNSTGGYYFHALHGTEAKASLQRVHVEAQERQAQHAASVVVQRIDPAGRPKGEPITPGPDAAAQLVQDGYAVVVTAPAEWLQRHGLALGED